MAVSTVNAVNGYQALNQPINKVEAPMAEAAERFTALLDQADARIEGCAAGAVDAQSGVEAISQAEMALQTAVTVRDRVVGAYQELLRMPL